MGIIPSETRQRMFPHVLFIFVIITAFRNKHSVARSQVVTLSSFKFTVGVCGCRYFHRPVDLFERVELVV